MLKSLLCDNSDAYIFVKETIKATKIERAGDLTAR